MIKKFFGEFIFYLIYLKYYNNALVKFKKLMSQKISHLFKEKNAKINIKKKEKNYNYLFLLLLFI